MSDATLRRDAREPDDADAEVRLLARRLRSGELARSALELAAWVGHEPSARALDVPDRPPLRLPEVLIGLERWGHATLVRGLLAIGRAAAPRLPAAQRAAADALCDRVLAWLEGDGNTASEAVLEAAEALRRQDAAPRVLDAVVRVATGLGAATAPLGPAELRARVWSAMEDVAPASAQDAAILAVGLTAWITANALPPPQRDRSLRQFVGWVRRAGVTDADMRDALLADLAPRALGGLPPR